MKLYLSGLGFEYLVKNIQTPNEASEIAQKFIEKYNLGSSTYDYGFVTDENKNLMYVIAYNGRILKPKEYFGNTPDKVSLNSDIGKIAVKKFNYKN